LAYLTGKIRTQDETAHRLLDDCVKRFTNVDLKGKAIQALGRLNDRQQKRLFEQIAMDTVEPERFKLRADISEPEKRYLRRTAIEALARIGDEETLKRLSQKRALGLHFELQQAIYRAREEIAWRTSLSESTDARQQGQMAWLRLLRGHHFDPFYFRAGDDDGA
jgi:HEAT repeat protein